MTNTEQNSSAAPPADEPVEAVGITGSGGAPLPGTPENPGSPSDSFNGASTKMHALLNELWGVNWQNDYAFGHLIRYANPQKVKKTEHGFELELLSGNSIHWNALSDGQGGRQEIIYKKLGRLNKSFTQDDAEAIIALAKLRGWNTIQVHGTDEHKEKLWLAVQRRNLADKMAFDLAQKNGQIPKTDKDGKPIEFTPAIVSNFKPDDKSKVLAQWQADLAQWQGQQQEEAIEAAVVPVAAPPAPEKPAADTKAAPKTPPKKPAGAKKASRKKNHGPTRH